MTISNTHVTTQHENKSSYFFVLACMLNFVGTYNVRNEIETKRNEINENETKRNEINEMKTK